MSNSSSVPVLIFIVTLAIGAGFAYASYHPCNHKLRMSIILW